MRWLFLLVALAPLAASGCRGAWPVWPPGTIARQQQEAVVHDPYPMNDIAPQDAGARPRDFTRPLPEAVRHQITPDTQIWLGR